MRKRRRFKGAVLPICLTCTVTLLALLGLNYINTTVDPVEKTQWAVNVMASLQATVAPSPTPTLVPTPTPSPTPSPAPPSPTPEPSPVPEMLEVKVPELPEYVRIRITGVGDCTLGGDDTSGASKYFIKTFNEKGADYFFSKTRDLLRADDLTVVNLEGPLTSNTEVARKKRFNFRGDTRFISILSGSSVEVANVANNHAMDYGEKGLNDTLAQLDLVDIAACGFGRTDVVTVKGVRVGVIGFSEVNGETLEEMLPVVEEIRPQCDILVASLHWGKEGRNDFTPNQQTIAHGLIDAGVDLILGTHPHVYAGMELYKGKYVVYSLGNFCFGGNKNPAEKQTWVFQQDILFDPETKALVDGGINVLPATQSADKKKNDFCPLIQENGDRAQRLLNKIFLVSTFKPEDVLWMADSYEVQNGLLGAEISKTLAYTELKHADPEALKAEEEERRRREEERSKYTTIG